MCSAKVRPSRDTDKQYFLNSGSKDQFLKYVIPLITSELFRFLDDQSGENIFVILFQSVIFHGPQCRLGLPDKFFVDVLAGPRCRVDRKLLLAGRRNGYGIRSEGT